MSMQPYDAFAELAALSLAEHTVDSVVQTVAELARRTVPGAAVVSVTVVERSRAATVAHTGPLALELDEQQYREGDGPCLSCIAGSEPVLVADTADEPRWPQWAARAAQQGAGSTLSIPLPLQREMAAALNVYGAGPAAFDDASVELARTFASYAAVALSNVQLYETQAQAALHLRKAMESRATIEQAKGILMSRYRCSAQQAFDRLVRSSQESNRKLHQVAQELVSEFDA